MIQDCIWRDQTEPNAAGNRWLICRREGCGNRMFGSQPHEHYKANCRSGAVAEPKPAGVGSELTALLSWFVRADKNKCQCQARAAEMDRNGVEWCEENFELIVGWLREGAAELDVVFVEPAARVALYTAIWRARRNLTAIATTTPPENQS